MKNKNIVVSLLDSTYEDRWSRIFDEILRNFPNGADTNEKNVFIEWFVTQVSQSILTSKGRFFISANTVFLMTDTRLYIVMDELSIDELRCLKYLIQKKLNEDLVYERVHMYQSIPSQYTITLEQRLNLLTKFFKFIEQGVRRYNFGSKIYTYQFKIHFCTSMRQICKVLEDCYFLAKKQKIDLTHIKQMFNSIIIECEKMWSTVVRTPDPDVD